MYEARYSSVIDCPVETVWSLIRDFNNYPRYIEGVTESVIEDDLQGDAVGAVRRFIYQGACIRQRLTAHSDVDRSFAYAGLTQFHYPASETSPLAPVDYEGLLRLMPVIDGDRTFVEWRVKFGAAPNEADRWREFLLVLIPQWVDSLRRALLIPH